MSEKKIVEVNGIKLEVSLTTDKRIDEYKIGDNVKILMKRYSGAFDSYPGIIVDLIISKICLLSLFVIFHITAMK